MATVAGRSLSRISIALCTFNGSQFLLAQLNSVLIQTRLPHEMVVCDDASSDNTLNILEEFARNSPFPVRVIRNHRCLGVTKNFEQAIRLCEGDVIVLADQDDVWLPIKLERMVDELAMTGVTAAFSDVTVVDAGLNPFGYTMWQRVRFGRSEQIRMARGRSLDVLLKHFVVTGAALAFRADLRPLILPIPSDWPHDAWIALVAANVGHIVPLAIPLLRYRQHAGNQVGGLKKPLLHEIRNALKVDRAGYYQREIARWQNLHERFPLWPEDQENRVKEKLEHLEARAGLPAARWKRIPGVFREVVSGRYARYARNWGSIALDVFIR